MLIYLITTYLQKLFNLGEPELETRGLFAFFGFFETVAELVLLILFIIYLFDKINKRSKRVKMQQETAKRQSEIFYTEDCINNGGIK